MAFETFNKKSNNQFDDVTNSRKVFSKLRMQITAISTAIIVAVLIVIFICIGVSLYNSRMSFVSECLSESIAKCASVTSVGSKSFSYDVLNRHTDAFDNIDDNSNSCNNNSQDNFGAITGNNQNSGELSSNSNGFSNLNSQYLSGQNTPLIGKSSAFHAEKYIATVAYKIDYSDSSLIAADNRSASLADDTLHEVQGIVFNAPYGFCKDDSLGLCYFKATTSTGDYIAFTDSSSVDYHIKNFISVFLIVLIIVGISITIVMWVVSGWIIQPVKDTWKKQTRFVADASHELKTPISVIVANSSLILNKNDIDAETRKWTRMTLEEAENMSSLVADMLYLATNEDETGKTREKLDLGHEIQRTAMQFETRAFEKGCEIEYLDVQKGVTVCMERQGLARVLSILLDNACKYSNNNTTITVSMKANKKNATLTIDDIGVVIPKGMEDSVFDRFFRADKSRTRENSYGLGLTMARDIIKKHDGSIKAETLKDGETTRFTVCLPVVELAQSKTKPRKSIKTLLQEDGKTSDGNKK